jgi:hypothetical protein
MALYLISYDVNEKNREEYQELWDYLDSLKSRKLLYSEYAVPFTGTALELANKITPHLKQADRLLVCELFNGASTCACKNLMISTADFSALLTKYARRLK